MKGGKMVVEEETKYSMLEMILEEGQLFKSGEDFDDKLLHRVKLAWRGVSYKANDKYILTDCWGEIPENTLTCIMGPSGAGKSTLLNVLAGRATQGKSTNSSGEVFVDNVVIDPIRFRKQIAYVMQEDTLLATSTPREALYFSAAMKLHGKSNKQLELVVNELLENLGLTACADVLIGNELIKGISGGQKKRTSVGIEMITNPKILFLDEPTSGLDSYSAFSLIALLKKIASQCCTMLCTIHQPSSEVFDLFDKAIFLKEGHVIYHGEVRDVVPTFASLGYHCPNNFNPSDYVMNLCQSVSVNECIEQHLFMPPNESVLSIHHAPNNPTEQPTVIPRNETEVFLKQLTLLTWRELLNVHRDVGGLIGRFVVTMVLSLLLGFIFFKAGGRDDSDMVNFNSHFGAISMVLIGSMFGTSQPIMLSFPIERPMFLREYSGGTYGAIAYFTSKLILEIPMNLLQTGLQFLMLYYMLELQGNFIFLVLAAWGLAMCSCSVAVLLGSTVTDVKKVTELAPLLFVPQMLFVGFFIRTSQIPTFLRWAQYVCSLKYAMNLILLTEFNATNSSCNVSDQAKSNCAALLRNNDITAENFYVYILLLFALFITFRMCGIIALMRKARY